MQIRKHSSLVQVTRHTSVYSFDIYNTYSWNTPGFVRCTLSLWIGGEVVVYVEYSLGRDITSSLMSLDWDKTTEVKNAARPSSDHLTLKCTNPVLATQSTIRDWWSEWSSLVRTGRNVSLQETILPPITKNPTYYTGVNLPYLVVINSLIYQYRKLFLGLQIFHLKGSTIQISLNDRFMELLSHKSRKFSPYKHSHILG